MDYNDCRFCLKTSPDMEDLFNYNLQPGDMPLVTFFNKLTDLNIIQEEFFPNRCCMKCIKAVENAYIFSQTCVASDKLLKKAKEKTVYKDYAKIKLEALMEPQIKITVEEKMICSKSAEERTLNLHQKVHKKGKRFNKCEFCNGTFKYQSTLKIHMKKHTNERPFICDTCGAGFRQSNDLKRHIEMHTDERPVLCNLCGKRFRRNAQLTVHLRSHTGEKPFKCEWCEKMFCTMNVLHRHEKIHTGERPYACNICKKTFIQHSTLKTHLKVHNHVIPDREKYYQEIRTYENSMKQI